VVGPRNAGDVVRGEVRRSQRARRPKSVHAGLSTLTLACSLVGGGQEAAFVGLQQQLVGQHLVGDRDRRGRLDAVAGPTEIQELAVVTLLLRMVPGLDAIASSLQDGQPLGSILWIWMGPGPVALAVHTAPPPVNSGPQESPTGILATTLLVAGSIRATTLWPPL
jgi:hypothetical protein